MGLSGNAENPQYMVANPDAPRHILWACSHYPTARFYGKMLDTVLEIWHPYFDLNRVDSNLFESKMKKTSLQQT